MDNRKEKIEGLRSIANFLEDHPELPLPDMDFRIYSLNSKEEAQAVARAFGNFEKGYSNWYATLTKAFVKGEFGAEVALSYVFNREAICERKVVGVRTIPAEFVPAHTTEARTEEIVEWDCGSILGEANANSKND